MTIHPETQITEAEWEVMQSVWEAHDQTAGEIIARINLGDRSHRTLRTLLARLVDKGAVTVRIDGTRHLYSAAVTREICVRSATRSFTQRFFSGGFGALLMHFVEHESLTDEDADELKRFLDSRTELHRKKIAKNSKQKRAYRRRKRQ